MKKVFSALCLSVMILMIPVFLIGCSVNHFFGLFANTDGLIMMQDDEQIVSMDCLGRLLGAVSDRGNCYIDGVNLYGSSYYGLSEEYRAKFNTRSGGFVSIYSGGDAVSLDLAAYGGCIVTERQEVYLFLNGTDGYRNHKFFNDDNLYRTPELFCTGYIDAKLANDSRIYLLKENGDFGYVTIDEPEAFHELSQNIKKFQWTVLNHENDIILFLLNTDGELFSINYKGEPVFYNIPELENAADFDCLSCGDDFYVFSVLNTDGAADVYIGNVYPVERTYDRKVLLKKTGENISSVKSYCMGIAMLDDQGDVRLYGSDASTFFPSEYKTVFEGEMVFHDVRAIYGSRETLLLIRNDGSFEQFGYQPDKSYRIIEPD